MAWRRAAELGCPGFVLGGYIQNRILVDAMSKRMKLPQSGGQYQRAKDGSPKPKTAEPETRDDGTKKTSGKKE